HDPVVAVMRAGGPDLLAVEHPLVAVANRARLQAGHVRAGAGLAEQLAPHLVGPQHLGDVALLLRLGAVGEDRGRAHPEADREDAGEQLVVGRLFVEGALVLVGQAVAAVLDRPGDAGEPTVVQPGLELLRLCDEVATGWVARLATILAGASFNPAAAATRVLLQPGPRLLPVLPNSDRHDDEPKP